MIPTMQSPTVTNTRTRSYVALLSAGLSALWLLRVSTNIITPYNNDGQNLRWLSLADSSFDGNDEQGHQFELAKKDAEIERLKWQLNMLQARPFTGISYPLENGLAALCIPTPVMDQMGHYEKHRLQHAPPDPPLPPEHNEGQVGKFVFEHMEVDAITRRPRWTLEIWEHLTSTLADGGSIAVPGYRGSDVDLMRAYQSAYPNDIRESHNNNTENRVLDTAVFSSISPWAEATLKHVFGSNAKVTTVDFNPCVLSDDLQGQQHIEACLSPYDLRSRRGPSFDIIVSFSGIEHDGLGRYGDPVNPNGDFGAMREFWLNLRPGGHLFLAVPTGPEHSHKNHSSGAFIDIWGNGHVRVLRHRVYTPTRFAKLFRGFIFEGWVDQGQFHPYQGEFPPGSGEGFCSEGKLGGNFQPVLVLRKNATATFDDLF